MNPAIARSYVLGLVAAMGIIGMLATGCRTAHLGPNTGHVMKDAFAAQQASNADDGEMSAADAKKTLQVQRGEKASDSSAAGAPGVPVIPFLGTGGGGGSSSASGDGLWQGSNGGITLKAK